MPAGVDDLLRRWGRLKGMRFNQDTTWQRVQEIVWPFAGDFNTVRAKGERRTDQIFETTATWALERFAAFYESLLTPRNQNWHKLRASEPELNDIHRVKQWFDRADRTLFQIRNDPSARFYSQKHEGYKALGAFGCDTLFVDGKQGGGIRYRYCHLGRVHIETDHENAVDTVYYAFPLTHAQAVKKWGNGAPEQALKGMENDPLGEGQYLHVVRPRSDGEYDPERIDAAGKRFESVMIAINSREAVERGGYHEQPYLFSRYTVNPAEMYGRGAAEMVLPDVETLQEQEKTMERAGHRAVVPPLLLHSDGPMGRGQRRVSMKPGFLNYGGVDANGKPTIRPLESGARLPDLEAMMIQKREHISTAFSNDLFLMLTMNKEMTATEVLERAKEKGQLLTPTTGRQESEMLGPMITREIRILQRQGVLPQLPPELEEAGGDFEIVYDNEASRLQRSEDALAIERSTTWLMDAVQKGADPTIVEIPDWHAMTREMFEINSVSPKLVKTKEDVERAIAAQAERSAAQENMEMATQAAGAAKDLAAAGVSPEEMANAAA